MYPGIVRNSLFSPSLVQKLLDLPREEAAYAALTNILLPFHHTKAFASEIQTETQLVRPMLKVLGYSVEPKPKFFEDQVKGPDFALFCSEEERLVNSKRWGTKEFYRNSAALLSVKRYGRNLTEGISGFYLDFENRIPVYQIFYLVKRAETPWGILTNGKNWILFRRPRAFEKRLIELDLGKEEMVPDGEILHLLYHLFSCEGLARGLPSLLEEERTHTIGFLKEKKAEITKALENIYKKMEVYPRLLPLCSQLFPEWKLPLTETYLRERNALPAVDTEVGPSAVNAFDGSDIFTFLLTRKGQIPFDVEEVVLEGTKSAFTKESLFALRVLDMTPGCGAVVSALLDGLIYLASTLPYRERNTFVAEWENEQTLNRYILDHVLYGVEKSHVALDILQNNIRSRFSGEAKNYRFGDALLGMSLADLHGFTDEKAQADLFSKPPEKVLQEFRDLYRTYFSLSDRIKEDIETKHELQGKLNRYADRLRDILDVMTAAYFTKKPEEKKTRELLYALESAESKWQGMREQDWFASSKELARRHGFFHMEIEFPLLLNDAFDLIIIQPSLAYVWEEKMPVLEVTKAYIKRAAAYLKPEGKIALITGDGTGKLAEELVKSKKYQVNPKETCILLKKG
ncbi:MAG TPA: class I SAM-dependent methyltransferase [Syntrophorhabdales bacterium]|nr:class I SAM-dependent methyltransferase [Syntrophorhabdales bacterium]